MAEDAVIEKEQAQRLHTALPDSRLTLLPGLGHMLRHFDAEAIAREATALHLRTYKRPATAVRAGSVNLAASRPGYGRPEAQRAWPGTDRVLLRALRAVQSPGVFLSLATRKALIVRSYPA